MPTVMSHAVVGLTLGTLTVFRRRGWTFWMVSAALPMLPDLDVFGIYLLGIRFNSMWGHRGISHSLAAALVIGVITALLFHRKLGGGVAPLALYCSLLVASHGFLDAFISRGPGVAFFAPFDATRYVLPWRPVPASPFIATFFSVRGWQVFKAELIWIWTPAAVIVACALIGRRRR